MSTGKEKSDILQGTLDLIVLRTLDSMGALHGLGLARRIEQIGAGAIAMNQGTIYPALLRLEQKGWIRSRWGTSDNHRRAKFYELTAAGKRQCTKETESWHRTVGLMEKFLTAGSSQ